MRHEAAFADEFDVAVDALLFMFRRKEISLLGWSAPHGENAARCRRAQTHNPEQGRAEEEGCGWLITTTPLSHSHTQGRRAAARKTPLKAHLSSSSDSRK